VEMYIPELGICFVKVSGHNVTVEVDCYREDLERLGAIEIEQIGCCGVCGKRGGRLKGDYQCVDCRESAGEIEFNATFNNF
jgi:hypothetical protein